MYCIGLWLSVRARYFLLNDKLTVADVTWQGFAAALKLASLGVDTLILGVRSLAKGEAAKKKIVMCTSIDASKILLYEVNYENFASVKRFAEAVIGSTQDLHVAILNAGVARPSRFESPEGWEMTLQVNTLSTAQLALNLVPKLRETYAKRGIQPVLEIVGSEAYLDVKDHWFKLDSGETLLSYCNDQRNWRVDRQYHISKLLVMFIQQGMVTSMQANNTNHVPLLLVVSPGMCRTSLGRDFGLPIKILMAGLQTLVATTAEEGSRALISGALQGLEAQGEFWWNDALNS